MAENRSALIVAVSEYQDAGLRRLVAPAQDAEALARVLGDPAIGGFAVKTLLNQPSHRINREIEAFFANRAKDDLLLLYFSGHGLKDEEGRLYFATTDTDRKFLRTTAVAATLINDVMYTCRSRRQVLILDCCYSGAFARGMTHRADETVGTGEYFREGRGQFVLTASDALQYAFEGDEVSGEGVRSVFTHTLVRGLETGEADLNGDGAITCDELYDYLYGRVTDWMPQQKPRKWAFAVEGEIIIARNPHPVVKPAALPAELQESIEDPLPWVREGAARHLGELSQHSHKGMAAAAQAALLQMAEDDSLKVRTVVAEILKAHAEKEAEATHKAEEVRRQAEEARKAEATRKAEEAPKAEARKAKASPPHRKIWRILLVILVLGVLGGTGLYYYSTKLEAERLAAADKAAADRAAADKARGRPGEAISIAKKEQQDSGEEARLKSQELALIEAARARRQIKEGTKTITPMLIRAVQKTGGLRIGDFGPATMILQQSLNYHGYDLAVSGFYDSETVNAVRAIQREMGLDIDGVFGEDDLRALQRTEGE